MIAIFRLILTGRYGEYLGKCRARRTLFAKACRVTHHGDLMNLHDRIRDLDHEIDQLKRGK